MGKFANKSNRIASACLPLFFAAAASLHYPHNVDGLPFVLMWVLVFLYPTIISYLYSNKLNQFKHSDIMRVILCVALSVASIATASVTSELSLRVLNMLVVALCSYVLYSTAATSRVQ